MKVSKLLGSILVTSAMASVSASTARADLAACGDIDVRARAECVVIPPSAQCETMCTPITVKATCSARLAAACDGSCTHLPSVDCSGSCMAGCTGECTADPGHFDCKASCEGDCDGRCDASCSSRSDGAACMAACSGQCSVSCQKRCDVAPPKADCNALCKASCDGSCTVDPNLDCQIDCQAKGYARCEADVTGGCKARCKTTEGALFCDGNYIDTGNKLQDCVAALKAAFEAHVTATSSGSSSCDAGTCSAKGAASVKTNCSVADAGVAGSPLTGVLLLLGFGGVVVRRRSRR